MEIPESVDWYLLKQQTCSSVSEMRNFTVAQKGCVCCLNKVMYSELQKSSKSRSETITDAAEADCTKEKRVRGGRIRKNARKYLDERELLSRDGRRARRQDSIRSKGGIVRLGASVGADIRKLVVASRQVRIVGARSVSSRHQKPSTAFIEVLTERKLRRAVVERISVDQAGKVLVASAHITGQSKPAKAVGAVREQWFGKSEIVLSRSYTLAIGLKELKTSSGFVLVGNIPKVTAARSIALEAAGCSCGGRRIVDIAAVLQHKLNLTVGGDPFLAGVVVKDECLGRTGSKCRLNGGYRRFADQKALQLEGVSAAGDSVVVELCALCWNTAKIGAAGSDKKHQNKQTHSVFEDFAFFA